MSTLSNLFNPFPAPLPRYYYDLSNELSPALYLSIPIGPHHTYTRPSLLVTDKLGDLPLDQASGNWIFQVVSRRYDLGSVILYLIAPQDLRVGRKCCG